MDFEEMMKNKFTISIVIIIIIAGAFAVYKFMTKRDESKTDSYPIYTKNEEIINITLYFGSEDSDEFIIESREIYKTKLSVNQAKQAILKLIEGPNNENASPVIPKDTKLRELYVENGHAYIDFSKEISENHPGGSKAESATIGSIVNTLIKNFSDIKDVQILVEGKVIDTLAGHIDIRQPFKETAEIKNKD
ncbi:GerMN domain-containing protein [Candidatus Desantisbacteria bacterium]|nr:GerMN domain-containing protein [Candidatus Desantisbacteria bacterium]